MEIIFYIDSASRFALELIINQLGRVGFCSLRNHVSGSQPAQHPVQLNIFFSAGNKMMEAEEYSFLLCLALVFS